MTVAATPPQVRTPRGVEVRSIDWFPLEARRGKPSSLFPLWFMSNANLTTLATGMVGAALGANFASLRPRDPQRRRGRNDLHRIPLRAGPPAGSCPDRSSRGRSSAMADRRHLRRGHHQHRRLQHLQSDPRRRCHQHDHGNRCTEALVRPHHGAGAGAGDRRLPLDPPHPEVAHLAVPGHIRNLLRRRHLHAVPLAADQFALTGINWPAFLVQFGTAAAYALGWAPYVLRLLPLPPAPRPALARRRSTPTAGCSSARDG